MADEPTTKTYKVAMKLHESGVSVIPTLSGNKKPAVNSWALYQEQLPNKDLLPLWFHNGNGLAVIGGKVSGNLLILDFDHPGLYDSFRQMCEDHGVNTLNQCAVVESPSGGNHVYLRSVSPVGPNDKIAFQTFPIPDNAEIEDRNGREYAKIAGKSYPLVDVRGKREYLKCVIETRGEGGYAVTYPTAGYRPIQGRIDQLPTLPAETVEVLLHIASQFDTYKPPQQPEPSRHTADNTGRNSPGNDYNAKGDYEQVLLDAGWQPLHRMGTRTTWVRPGKTEREVSATTGYKGSRMLYVFSTNASPFDPGRMYSPFAVYTILEHDGDFAEAARTLGREGFGEPATTPKVKKPRVKEKSVADREAEAAEKDQDQSKQYLYALAWAELNKDRYIYLTGDQWFEYHDGYWEYSSAEDVQRSVQQYLAGVTQVTAALVGNVRTLAKSMIGPHRLSDFNAHSNCIPLRNGVLDTLTGDLLPHSPDNRLTHQAPYDYIPDADCPTWKRCLDQWLITSDGKPCQEWLESVQEWFGYCLISDNTAQLSMMWVGGGANGKGTTCRALAKLVGKQFTTSIPIEQLHDPYHRAELYGKLVGFVDEPDPRAMIKNGNHFKAIVGGDSISARRPTEKVFTFTPMTRLVISCNALPANKDLSHGYYRRLLLIDWRYNVPQEMKDEELDDKLEMELPGIFNWALEGLARWRGRKRKFIIPEESKKLLEEYRLEQDNLRRYMAETCLYGPKAYVQNTVFYEGYRKFCEDYSERPEPAKAIAARLSKMGYASEFEWDKETQKSYRVYRGLDIGKEKQDRES